MASRRRRELADGRRLEAKRAVIANAHPQLVFGDLRAAGHRRRAGFRATSRSSAPGRAR